MELVGRDRELAAVGQALEDVARGTHRAFGVFGEMGLGKTALLATIGERARAAGMLVLDGRAAEHERDVPFGPVIDALEDHVATLAPQRLAALEGDLGALAPADRPTGPAERFRHHRALRELLAMLGRERPLALLLDDLHWADEASVELVLHLLRRPPHGRVLLGFAMRPVDPALRVLEAARDAPAWQPLTLAPLAREAALAIVDVEDAEQRERVVRRALGNPLFLRELAAAGRLGDRTPRTLLAAVACEVAALPGPSRTLLEGAAVAGDPFDPELAAAASGCPWEPGALDALVAADLVREANGRDFAFRHPVVRRAVYDAVPPALRLAAHERVAAVLEARGARPARRAYHVEQYAHPGDEAAIELLCAAGAAAAASAPATAARWYAAGLRLVGDRDLKRRAELLDGIASALAAVGRMDESRDALVELLDLPGPEPRLSLVVRCAAVEGVIGRHTEARTRLLDALRDAPPDAHGSVLLGLATAASYVGDVQGMRHWAERAAAAGDDPLLVAEAESCGALGALWDGDGRGAGERLDRATERLRGVELDPRPDCARQLADTQLLAERYADAAETAMRGLASARRTQRPETFTALLIYRAGALGNLLELDAARREIDAAEESARLQGIPHVLAVALWQRTIIHRAQAAAPLAARDAAEFAELAATLEPNTLINTGLCSTAPIDDPDAALRTILRIAGPDLDAVLPSWGAALLLTVVRCALALDRHDDAHRWAALARERAAALQLPASHVRSLNATAEVLLATDRPQAAATLATTAAATGERAQTLRDAAESRLIAGRALAAAGDTDRAIAVLQRLAADTARGAALALNHAAARELRRLGSRPDARTRRAASRRSGTQLTDREQQIADLVAGGHSNQQIAAALYLSEKTVRNTLTRVYATLGVRSRSQLARLAAEADAVTRRTPART